VHRNGASQTGEKQMTANQIKAAIAQSEKIIAIMDVKQKEWFCGLDTNNQFLFICAALAATA
jgi:hypothetical protein